MTLWKTRNARVFDNKIVGSPSEVAYKLVTMLTFSKPMLQKKVIEEVEEMTTKLTQSCAEVGA
jgi:hypothetical protein